MAMRRLATPVTGIRALMANASEAETRDTMNIVRRKMKYFSTATWKPETVTHCNAADTHYYYYYYRINKANAK